MRPHAHGRLALATSLALGCIGLAMLAPLHAMRAWLPSVTPKMRSQGLHPTQAAETSRAVFAPRLDATGNTRRVYFPAAAEPGDVATRARRLLARESRHLGVAAASSDLECTSVRWSPSGAHVRFQQWHEGTRVWGGEAVVSFEGDGRPTILASDLAAMEGQPAALPSLDAATVTSRAEAQLTPPFRATPPAELYWRAFDHAWRLVWCVRRPCGDPVRDWELWFDAHDGTLLERRDRSVHATGLARVFLPDPVLVVGNRALNDGGDADAAVPAAAYTDVVLRDLDAPLRGYYRLTGPYARLRDWEAPAGAPDSSLTADFRVQRSAQGFEDAMVYYHLDAMQRWYQELGFTDANRRQQVADAHGVRGYDNSRFVPTLHWLSFGEGGVDDAEDAGVIVHEYGHATQYDIVPTWGTGGHTGAMGEGFGDYLAYSYAFAQQPERVRQWNGVFLWDGHNEFWPGRAAMDPGLLYPRDATLEVHRSGTLWCSALTDALHALGDRAVLDRLALDHHYALTGAATMEDAANAMIASDVAIHRGVHASVLAAVFARWGILAPGDFAPVILQHVPLDVRDAQDGAPRLEVRAVATGAALDLASVAAQVRTAGGAWTRVPLASQAHDVFAATLPLPATGGAVVEYFLEASDVAGNTARLPEQAPLEPYRFVVGWRAERFEADSGWTIGIQGDDATQGRWVRAAPIGTAMQPATDHTATGSFCFVTANVQAGAPASDGDVDGGRTTLLSPPYDLTGAEGIVLEYWRWFACDGEGDDTWRVEASANDGQTWVELEHSVAAASRWQRFEHDLSAALGTANVLRLRFSVADRGDASVVEAALDDVVLLARTASSVAVLRSRGFLRAASPAAAPVHVRYGFETQAMAQLAVFDVRGRRVRTLIAAPHAAGVHAITWDGRDQNGQRVARGMYVLRLVTAHETLSTKLILHDSGR